MSRSVLPGSVVAWARNFESQQRRGKLRGSVVPCSSYTYVCAGVCVPAHACVCVSARNHGTAQLCRPAAGCAVTRARNRATLLSIFPEKGKRP